MQDINHTQNTRIIFNGGNNVDSIGASSSIIEHTDERGKTTRVMYDLGLMLEPTGLKMNSIAPDITKYLGLQELNNLDQRLIKSHHKEIGGSDQTSLDALFLTHMHEDHIGGIVHLARCGYTFPPIYGSRETIAIVNEMMNSIEPHHNLNLIAIDGPVYVNNNFIVTPFPVSHTVMGAYGFHTLTKVNKENHAGIVNMGDFNLAKVAIGQGYDEKLFSQFLSKKFITHVMLDSTSSDNPNLALTTFEQGQDAYEEIMKENVDKRVISAVISRSTQNLVPILRAAKKQNRTVFLDGYMQRMVYHSLQKLYDLEEFKDVVYSHNNVTSAVLGDFLKKYSPDEQVIIFSGAFAEQGDLDDKSMSGLVKVSETLHKYFSIDTNSVVVLGQRIIPVGIIPDNMRKMASKLSTKNNQQLIQNEGSNDLSLGNYKKATLQRSGHATAREVYTVTRQIFNDRLNSKDELHIIPVHGNLHQLRNTENVFNNNKIISTVVKNDDYLFVERNYTKIIHPNKKQSKKWFGFQQEAINNNPKNTILFVCLCEEARDNDGKHMYKKVQKLTQIYSQAKQQTPNVKKRHHTATKTNQYRRHYANGSRSR